MPEDAMGSPLNPVPDGASARLPGTKPAVMLKIGSRLGVWGLVGGLGTMTAFAVGAPISFSTAIVVMGGGLLVSGLGTLLGAAAALSETRPLPGTVRAAAFAGLPLGTVLSLLGVTSLTQWGALVSVVNALTLAAGIMGALVVILLVVGFFVGPPSIDDSGSASEY